MNIKFPEEPNQIPLNELDTKLAFVKYSYDFLNQITQTSETLKLKHVTYFLAMAIIETNEKVTRLQAQRVLQETDEILIRIG
jgi:hypothetical protein